MSRIILKTLLGLAVYPNRVLGLFANGWNRFWFEPRLPHTLGILRILTGLCLLFNLYSYGTVLEELLGNRGWVDPAIISHTGRAPWNISYLSWIPGGTYLQLAHWCALAVALLFTVGACTPLTAPLALVIHFSYVNQNDLLTFGFDYVLTFLLLYLWVGPCGQAYSIDRLLKGSKRAANQPSSRATLAIRLMQIHMALMYFLAGIGKHGRTWLDGTAMQRVLGSYETSPFGAGFLVDYPGVLAAAGFATMILEAGFAFLVWFQWFRPWILWSMVLFHISVAFMMRLPTFSVVMIIGCASYVDLHRIMRTALPLFTSCAQYFGNFSGRRPVPTVNSKSWVVK